MRSDRRLEDLRRQVGVLRGKVLAREQTQERIPDLLQLRVRRGCRRIRVDLLLQPNERRVRARLLHQLRRRQHIAQSHSVCEGGEGGAWGRLGRCPRLRLEWRLGDGAQPRTLVQYY